jgi:TPR repeat protein
MQSIGVGTARSCHVAVQTFKTVAERGDWSAELADAFTFYESGDSVQALMRYSLHATMGVESAQANAAFILAKGMCPIPLRATDAGATHRGAYLNASQWNTTRFSSDVAPTPLDEIERAYRAACEAR